MRSSEQSTSVWEATTPALEFAPLTEDLSADVCVVGAGIAGMSVAYELGRTGKHVVVLDDNAVGGGETGQSTAHLTSAMDDGFFILEELHGREGSRLAYESNQAAVERISTIAAHEKIDCDLVRVDGYLFLEAGQTEDLLVRERDAALRAGFEGVELLPRSPLTSFDTGLCLRFPRQGRFHPLKYLAGLARCLQRDGGQIFTGTRVVEIRGGSDAMVRTSAGRTVRCSAIVVATNSPINDLVAIHTKQVPCRTYVIAARLPHDAVPDALYWDAGDPYHYIRLQRLEGGEGSHTVLIVGGEDHPTGTAPKNGDPYLRLEDWTRARFPVEEVEHRWSGQVTEPVDGVAFIGRNPMDEDNVFVVTGDSGQGITHGAAAGMLISDLVGATENPWAKLYDPSRVTLKAKSVGEFARAALKVVGHYAEYVTGAPGEVGSVDEVQPGTGAVLRRGAKRLAVYRDEDGVPHVLSAACTHLGCIVRWNEREMSWDCPCHGSRFDPRGRVLNGPASTNLEAAGEEG